MGKTAKPLRPSVQMLHVLNLASQQGADIWWVPLVNGKGSQSRTVGRMLTIEACQRHGWLDQQGNLTPAGRAARDAEKERLEGLEAKRRQRAERHQGENTDA